MDTELAQTQEKASSSLIRNSSCMETDGNSIWLQKNIFYQTSAIDAVTKEVFQIHIHTQGIPPSVLVTKRSSTLHALPPLAIRNIMHCCSYMNDHINHSSIEF